MLAFLLKIAASSYLPKVNTMVEEDNKGQSTAVYFDILVFSLLSFSLLPCLDGFGFNLASRDLNS